MTIADLAGRARASVTTARAIREFAANVRYRTVWLLRARILNSGNCIPANTCCPTGPFDFDAGFNKK